MLDGSLSVYKFVDCYVCVCTALDKVADRLLLGTRSGRIGPNKMKFFTNQLIGCNSLGKIVPSTCKALGITGVGPHEKVTTARSTCYNANFTAGFRLL